MAADPRGFLPASDAANGIVTDLALHQECTEIERIILVQSSYGFVSATISSTLMTSNAFFAPLTVTAVDTVHNTITIPGLAAEIAANNTCMSCSSNTLLGFPVQFSSTNLLPEPFVTQTTYYLIPTTTTDVYQVASTKQNCFQCPPIVLTLANNPSTVTGTTTISGNLLGTGSILNAIGVPGNIVINNVSIPVTATETLAQLVAAINAAAIPNIVASVAYTYSFNNNNNCGPCNNSCNCNPCNCQCNNYNGGCGGNCGCNYNNINNSVNNTIITAAYLEIENTVNGATTIGAGSTSALLNVLGLSAGTFGQVGQTGTLIINGQSVTVNSTDTLTTVVANINAAAIPNITAALSANGSSLVISDSAGTAITIGANPTVITGTELVTSTVGSTGNLVINGVTVSILSADTLANVITAINTAAIPNIVASSSSSYLVLTNSVGGSVTIGSSSSAGVLTALGFTSGQTASSLMLSALGLNVGTQQSSTVSAIPQTQSELYYAAWKNIYFFPEQQQYVNLMAAVMTYFQSVGYNIIRQQQTDANGNPISAFSWYITW